MVWQGSFLKEKLFFNELLKVCVCVGRDRDLVRRMGLIPSLSRLCLSAIGLRGSLFIKYSLGINVL